MSKRPELIAAERVLPYAKFYDLPITPILEKKLAALAASPIDPSLALKIEDRSDLSKPGYLPHEINYCVMSNGAGFLANRTKMPGVIPKMFEWWSARYSLEDPHCRIWDPEDYYHARQQMREKTLDQSPPMRERIWGIAHHVLEGAGPGPDELVLEFRYSHGLGYEEEKMGTDVYAALICASGHDPAPDQGTVATMAHFIRETPGGIELRPRSWIGYDLADDRLVKLVPDGMFVPEEAPMGLFAHNLEEFGHSTVILPQVYAENRNNW